MPNTSSPLQINSLFSRIKSLGRSGSVSKTSDSLNSRETSRSKSTSSVFSTLISRIRSKTRTAEIIPTAREREASIEATLKQYIIAANGILSNPELDEASKKTEILELEANTKKEIDLKNALNKKLNAILEKMDECKTKEEARTLLAEYAEISYVAANSSYGADFRNTAEIQNTFLLFSDQQQAGIEEKEILPGSDDTMKNDIYLSRENKHPLPALNLQLCLLGLKEVDWEGKLLNDEDQRTLEDDYSIAEIEDAFAHDLSADNVFNDPLPIDSEYEYSPTRRVSIITPTLDA